MNLMSQLKKDAQQALKVGNKQLATDLRYLYSLLQTEQARQGGQFDQSKAIKLLQKEMKDKKKALEMFEKAGREELVKQQKKEISVLKKYLPKMMSREEIKSVVENIVDQDESDNFGKIMGQVMLKLKGKADGEAVAEIVKEVL